MKGKMSFIIFVVAVVGLLLLYTFTSEEFPRLPADAIHGAAITPEACMACHGPGKKNEMKKTHPPKFDCPKCHKRAK
jgi:mono/diheme cytochrome c family protein